MGTGRKQVSPRQFNAMKIQLKNQSTTMSQERKEFVFSQWDTIDEHKKNVIINEFRMKYRGSYTQQIFLTFLEQKLATDSEAQNAFNRL